MRAPRRRRRMPVPGVIVRRVITQSVRVHFCFVEPSLSDGISTIRMPAPVLGPYMRRANVNGYLGTRIGLGAPHLRQRRRRCRNAIRGILLRFILDAIAGLRQDAGHEAVARYRDDPKRVEPRRCPRRSMQILADARPRLSGPAAAGGGTADGRARPVAAADVPLAARGERSVAVRPRDEIIGAFAALDVYLIRPDLHRPVGRRPSGTRQRSCAKLRSR